MCHVLIHPDLKKFETLILRRREQFHMHQQKRKVIRMGLQCDAVSIRRAPQFQATAAGDIWPFHGPRRWAVSGLYPVLECVRQNLGRPAARIWCSPLTVTQPFIYVKNHENCTLNFFLRNLRKKFIEVQNIFYEVQKIGHMRGWDSYSSKNCSWGLKKYSYYIENVHPVQNN